MMPDWQPIDTAPLTGDTVLLWKDDERMVGEYMLIGYWDHAHFSGTPGWVPVGGHNRLGYFSEVTQSPQGYPMFWAPSPSPPEV
jgi:hypothetical protein